MFYTSMYWKYTSSDTCQNWVEFLLKNYSRQGKVDFKFKLFISLFLFGSKSQEFAFFKFFSFRTKKIEIRGVMNIQV